MTVIPARLSALLESLYVAAIAEHRSPIGQGFNLMHPVSNIEYRNVLSP